MKKTLISVAVLGAMSSAAFAQSNVTIYGIVDAGIVSERGGKAGNVTKLSSGVANASRIGFRGTEDLGGGLSAIFTLETGYRVDDGALDNSNNQLFNRQAFVGLRSNTAGTLTVGRQYTPWYNALAQVGDPFQAGLAGSAKNLFPANGINLRNSNSVVYQTPVFSGFSGEFFYGFGEQAESSAGRQLGAAVSYTNGGLNARIAYNNRNNDTATGLAPTIERGIGRNSLLAVNYDFNVAKAYFMYGQNKGLNSIAYANSTAYTTTAVPASQDSRDWLAGVQVPVAGKTGKIIASYMRVDDKEIANRDAHQWALGYMHDISKRTTGYISYAKITNKNGASYTVGGNTEAGTGDSAFNVGVRHSF
ncbi:putative porin [Pseudoduganella flava]|uniref:Porin n=2 Tax=Pseudoduganella flava TaxID=871742 RepID=A0A562Q3B2_9BURK|nr:porin [Pseudoduganella flava]QGZ41278.1 porin [Pseudoduganella flava]TWI51217.1 putative porin [Pseudoduganella flava]